MQQLLIAENQRSESVVLLKMGEELALGKTVVGCESGECAPEESTLSDHSAIMTDLPVCSVEKGLRVKPSQ